MTTTEYNRDGRFYDDEEADPEKAYAGPSYRDPKYDAEYVEAPSWSGQAGPPPIEDYAADPVGGSEIDGRPVDGAEATLVSEQAPLPKHDLPVLEIFRGIAALMVLTTHVGFTSGDGWEGPWAGWLSRLDFGVALFFLLSGFLLFRPFVQAAYGRRPVVAVRAYLRRRLVRIYPAFLVALAADYLISAAARKQPGTLWFQTLLLVQNYPRNFVSQLDGMVQTWSLVVEVSFYVTLPLLAWLALGRGTAMARNSARAAKVHERAQTPVNSRRDARQRRQRPLSERILGSRNIGLELAARRPGIVIGIYFVIAIGIRIYYLESTHGLGRQLLWLPPFLDWFGAGMLLAWLREREAPLPKFLRYLANFPGVSWSLALAVYWLTTTSLAGPYGLQGATTADAMLKHIAYVIIAFLLLTPPVFGDLSARWRGIATRPVFLWLGQISFGVFLWHPIIMEAIRRVLRMPVIGGYFWPTLLLTLALSCAAGTLSYRYIEEPAQRHFRNGFRLTPGRAGQRKPVVTGEQQPAG